MPIFTRTKRVTDPLDDRVKDRIVGRDKHSPAYVSSGSEHSAAGNVDHDDDTFLDCFLHLDEQDVEKHNDDNEVGLDTDLKCESERTDTDEIISSLVSIFNNQNKDLFRNMLLANVIKAINMFLSIKPNKQILNRHVMMFLKKHGYNAGICKTKWESCGGLTSGSHEFIDVIESDHSGALGTRYYIDVNFAGEFDIARETEHYRRLSQHLPTVFVGKSEDLKRVVKLLSDATKRSLKSRGLLLPPWRKNRFMQNKWFGPYRRTVNYTPTNVSVFVEPVEKVVKCRSIGFNAVNATLLSAATRTR